jgi:hypothetical protein
LSLLFFKNLLYFSQKAFIVPSRESFIALLPRSSAWYEIEELNPPFEESSNP